MTKARKPVDPTPAEIAERAAEIRAEWPAHKQGPPRQRERGGKLYKLWAEVAEPKDV